MSKGYIGLIVVALLMIALVASSVSAKARFDNRDQQLEMVKKFGLRPDGTAKIKRMRSAREVPGSSVSRQSATSLGAVSPEAGSYGYTFETTWDDWANYGAPPMVAHRPGTQLFFNWIAQPNAGANRGMGVQMYDPAASPGGAWANNSPGGCVLQTTDVIGLYPSLGVMSDGRVAVTGYISDETAGDEHEVRYQSSPTSCFFQTSTVPPATYQVAGIVDPTSSLIFPRIEVQERGGQTWVHVAGVESGWDETLWDGQGGQAMIYARKQGISNTGTWQDAIVIDTCPQIYMFLTSARNSDKVAVSYCKIKEGAPAAIGGESFYDQEVFYRESTDLGATWAAPVNVCNYSRVEASFTAWLEATSRYDSENNLHIIWNALPILENGWDNPAQDWGTDWNAILMHWRYLDPDPTDSATSRIHSAVWPDGGQTICAFHGGGMMTAGQLHLGECAGNIYVVWMMANDQSVDPPLEEDCIANEDGYYGGNGEIYMSVSSDLSGNSWDLYRNITHTITPDCDSAAGLGGACEDDIKPNLAPFGMDRQTGTLPWNDLSGSEPQYWFWSNVDWQSPDSIEGTWTNDSILPLMWTVDRWPGRASSDQGDYTQNDQRFLQLACVDPVTASRISILPNEIDYPTFGENGVEVVKTFSVRNDGNVELNVTDIWVVEDSVVPPTGGPYTGWLEASATSLLSIPFGTEVTLDVTLNKNGLVDNPGEGRFMFAHVYLESDAANADTMGIPIVFLIADGIENLAYDTVASGGAKGPGDYVMLEVNNMGAEGRNGIGGVNMDFTAIGGDCDPLANVYLYSGSLLLMEDQGDTVRFNTSLHDAQFSLGETFVPLLGDPSQVMHSGSGTDYDSVFSGRFANYDTSLVFSKTYYAPTTNTANPSFVVIKTTMEATDGLAKTGLTLGSAMDWDLPGDSGSGWNGSGVSVGGKFVYMQGTDTLDDPELPEADCEANVNRFATEAFLGMHTTSEHLADPCEITTEFYGAFVDSFHGWWDDGRDTNHALILDTIVANSGLSAATYHEDLAMFQTYVTGYTLEAGEELTVYTAYAAMHKQGDVTGLELSEFENYVEDVRSWLSIHFGLGNCGCCVGTMGSLYLDSEVSGFCDADSTSDQTVDVADLTNMIDHLFINFTPICCPDENDFAPLMYGEEPQDGAIDVVDLTGLIDHLFINFPALPACP